MRAVCRRCPHRATFSLFQGQTCKLRACFSPKQNQLRQKKVCLLNLSIDTPENIFFSHSQYADFFRSRKTMQTVKGELPHFFKNQQFSVWTTLKRQQ